MGDRRLARLRRWLGAGWFDYMATLARTLGLAILGGGALLERLDDPIVLLTAAVTVIVGSFLAREAAQLEKEDEDDRA